MAPKRAKNSVFSDPKGMFSGMVVYLIENGVQARRVQIWKQRLMQMGATVEDRLSKKVTHIFAMNLSALSQQVDCERLKRFKGTVLSYQWLEDSLKRGVKEPQDSYTLAEKLDAVREKLRQSLDSCSKSGVEDLENDESSPFKKTRTSKEIEVKWTGNRDEDKESSDTGRDDLGMLWQHVTDVNNDGEAQTTTQDSSDPAHSNSGDDSSSGIVPDAAPKEISLYNAPDLNGNITEIFGKLVNIYRALGDDRRSFSYYKAISVIEKLPFKIESVDQVKHLPAIGKSMQDHIQEIYTTGRLSKLEHFERDEKVRTITLFGEVWGIGPVTALKLYEKGHRTLDDLKNEDSLTTAQRVGLEFFDDIKKRIPRDEVKNMEILLQKSGDAVLPGVVVVCGGSFRRGKATCGDLDIVITHPDGKSHKGFLHRYVQYLKDIKFLREDLVFNTHSIEGTDSGVDTYFGLCTYPGREHRHRIDLKVYPVDNYAFGLIAWTGNDVLNRRLRLLAESKGYRLDDTGLYLATQSSAGKKGVKYSTNMSCKSEKEVFDVLGFPWLEPHERNLETPWFKCVILIAAFRTCFNDGSPAQAQSWDPKPYEKQAGPVGWQINPSIATAVNVSQETHEPDFVEMLIFEQVHDALIQALILVYVRGGAIAEPIVQAAAEMHGREVNLIELLHPIPSPTFL